MKLHLSPRPAAASILATRPACAGALALIIAYFLRLAGDGLRTGLTHDDLMNLYRAWLRPWPELALDNLLFFRFSPTYRPLGAVFYKASFDAFGLNPFPLRVVCYLVLGANAILVYLVGRRLSGSREAGVLAALLLAYHPNFGALYYSTGFCYDIFSFFFYFTAFLFYVRVRQEGKPWSASRACVFFGLFALALDSKEMAVTLPVLTLLYELIYHPPERFSPERWKPWIARRTGVSLAAGAMTAAFIYWRVYATPHGVGWSGSYTGNYSLFEYLDHVRRYLESLLRTQPVSAAAAALVMLALPAAAWLFRSPGMKLGGLLFLIGILPVAFIPARDIDSIYIPLAGLAIFIACGIVGARDRALRQAAGMARNLSAWRAARQQNEANSGAGLRRQNEANSGVAVRRQNEPNSGVALRRQNQQNEANSGAALRRQNEANWPAGARQAVTFVLCLLILMQAYRVHGTLGDWLPEQQWIHAVAARQRQLHPALPKGGRLLFLEDPFDENMYVWGTVFLTQLNYNDPALTVDRLFMLPAKPDAAAMAAYDHVFTMDGGKLVEVNRKRSAENR